VLYSNRENTVSSGVQPREIIIATQHAATK